LASAAAERFDLRRDVPFRLSMVRLAPDDVVVGICLHHIVYDGWSAHVLFGDLAALYESERTGLTDRLPELPVQYADFSIWQRERLTGPDAERIAGYWRDQLAGVPEQLRLAPAPHTREGATDPGGMVIRDLPAETVASIRRLSTREAATPYMIVLAALGTLVAARAGRDDIVIGSPVTDRDHPDLDHLIGLFVNTQVLRLRIEQGAEFRATLASVRKVCLDALAHRGMPFGDIVRMVAPKRAADASPLVQISYAFQNPTDRRLVLDGRSAEDFPVLPTVGRFELTVEVYDWTTGMGCALQYDPAIYRREFIEAFADDFVTLLGETTGDPDRAVRIRSRGEEADRLRDRSRDRLLALKGLSPH
jgi:hypothetical protein